jgi:hypothetical protein
MHIFHCILGDIAYKLFSLSDLFVFELNVLGHFS